MSQPPDSSDESSNSSKDVITIELTPRQLRKEVADYLREHDRNVSIQEDLSSILPGNQLRTEMFIKVANIEFESSAEAESFFLPKDEALLCMEEGELERRAQTIANYFKPRPGLCQNIYIICPILTVLEEQGLAYQQKSQARRLRPGILNTAVIRVSEAQALVSFSAENDMYYLEDSLVDWKSVCAMVEGLALEGLKGLYTEQVCKKLYDAEIFPFEKHRVQQACNWESLRGAFFVRKPWSMDTILVPDPQKSGTCPRCLTYVHLLSEHEPSCTGRCEDCVRSGRPCIRPTGKKTCVTYRNTPNDNYRDNFSHKDQAQPKQRTQCYKCWDFKEKTDVYNRIRYCSGRCEA